MREPGFVLHASRRYRFLIVLLALLGCDDDANDDQHDGAIDVEDAGEVADAVHVEPPDAELDGEQDACIINCRREDAAIGTGTDASQHDGGPVPDSAMDAEATAPDASATEGGADAVVDAPLDAVTLPDATVADGSAEAATNDASALRSVTIRFKAEVSGQDFACGRIYAGQGSTAVDATPSDFRFFLHELRLISSQGADVAVAMDERAPWQNAEVALIDFEDGQGSCVSGNPETNVVVTGKVPEGAYAGVAFRVGVPTHLNHGNPAQAPAALKNAPSTLWSWLSGYKFLLAELQQVVPTGQIPGLGLVHVGSTACSGNPQQGGIACARPNRSEIRLRSFDADGNTIVADLGTIHAQTDVSQDAQCHAAGAVCLAPFAAVGVDFSTGQPLAAHPAFRVR